MAQLWQQIVEHDGVWDAEHDRELEVILHRPACWLAAIMADRSDVLRLASLPSEMGETASVSLPVSTV
jgi:hypothetical protein